MTRWQTAHRLSPAAAALACRGTGMDSGRTQHVQTYSEYRKVDRRTVQLSTAQFEGSLIPTVDEVDRRLCGGLEHKEVSLHPHSLPPPPLYSFLPR